MVFKVADQHHEWGRPFIREAHESGHYMDGHGWKHTVIGAFSCMTKIRKSYFEIVKITHRTQRNFFTHYKEKERLIVYHILLGLWSTKGCMSKMGFFYSRVIFFLEKGKIHLDYIKTEISRQNPLAHGSVKLVGGYSWTQIKSLRGCYYTTIRILDAHLLLLMNTQLLLLLDTQCASPITTRHSSTIIDERIFVVANEQAIIIIVECDMIITTELQYCYCWTCIYYRKWNNRYNCHWIYTYYY